MEGEVRKAGVNRHIILLTSFPRLIIAAPSVEAMCVKTEAGCQDDEEVVMAVVV